MKKAALVPWDRGQPVPHCPAPEGPSRADGPPAPLTGTGRAEHRHRVRQLVLKLGRKVGLLGNIPLEHR